MAGGSRGHLRDLAGRTSIMLLGRAVQAVCGMATFVLLARTLRAEAYGQILTALAVPALLAAVLGDALSDAEIVDGASSGVRRSVTRAVWSVALCVAVLVALLPVPLALVLCTCAGALYVSIAVTAAPRIAHARRAGNAVGIATANASGALATALTVGVLLATETRYWPAFSFVFVLQPMALLFLPAPPAPGRPLPLRTALRRVSETVGPFIASQAAWPFISQLNILVLRVIMGAEAVGIYGAMMRVIDFLGIVGPIVGTFALPTFAAARSLPAETYAHVVGRINVIVGCVAVSVIVIGIQFGWLVWRAIYPGSAFPAGSYALLAVGASVSAASGLPDRVLQAAGEARVVATAALSAAAIFVPSTFLLTALFGIPGACAAWLLVIGGVNLVLLRASALSEVARQRHMALIAIGILASIATLISDGSLSQSLVVGAIASLATLLVAVTAFRDAPVAISA